jgi:sigma-B regulation protein RsbU (phosphoserine phosphatase)
VGERSSGTSRPRPHRERQAPVRLLADRRRVLVADGDPESRQALLRFLAWIGISEVTFASAGQDVLQLAGTVAPDLILLAAGPDSPENIDICRRLRASAAGTDVAIIMMATSRADQMRARCFQAGANDVVTKPVNPREFVARVSYHLERRAMMDELRGFRERVQRDLWMARTMQMALIPDTNRITATARAYGLDIAAHFDSCDEIGGDVWSLMEIDEHRLGVLIADFAGHGITAAINAFRLHTLLSQCPPQDLADPGAALTRINFDLWGLLPSGQYCTAFYGVLDRRSGTLAYAGAAHPSPFLGDSKGAITPLDAGGTLLGCFGDEVYRTHTVPLPADGFLFLYSDMLTEGRGADGTALAEEGLKALVVQAATGSGATGSGATGSGAPGSGATGSGAPGSTPLDAVLAGFTGRRHNVPCDDDLTAVWIAWGQRGNADTMTRERDPP